MAHGGRVVITAILVALVCAAAVLCIEDTKKMPEKIRTTKRTSSKNTRSTSVPTDPEPTPAATRVPPITYSAAPAALTAQAPTAPATAFASNPYVNSPFAAQFMPGAVDLSAFFQPQFTGTNAHHGLDLEALYREYNAQYGGPQTLGGQAQTDYSSYFNQPAPAPATAPSIKQANRQPVYYQTQRQPSPANYNTIRQSQRQPSPSVDYSAVSQRQPNPAQRQPTSQQQYVSVFQSQRQPSPADYASVYQQTPQSSRTPAQGAAAHAQPTVDYSALIRQSQGQAPSAAAAASPVDLSAYYGQQGQTRPSDADIKSLINAQVASQIKGSQGIQLLDLSEFYGPKAGQGQAGHQAQGGQPGAPQSTFYQLPQNGGPETGGLTLSPAQLAYYQQQSQSSGAAVGSAANPTLSPEQLSAYYKESGHVDPSVFRQPQQGGSHGQQPSGVDPSFYQQAQQQPASRPTPTVHQQQPPRPVTSLVYQQQGARPSPSLYQQQGVRPDASLYQQQGGGRPDPSLYQQQQQQQGGRPAHIVYQLQGGRPDPNLYQQQGGRPDPSLYQQQGGRPDPSLYQQQGGRPSTYQQQGGRPDPSQYQQQSGRPDPSLYQQQGGRPAPNVIYQQQGGRPASVVYQQQRPSPVVYQQQEESPDPSLYEQQQQQQQQQQGQHPELSPNELKSLYAQFALQQQQTQGAQNSHSIPSNHQPGGVNVSPLYRQQQVTGPATTGVVYVSQVDPGTGLQDPRGVPASSAASNVRAPSTLAALSPYFAQHQLQQQGVRPTLPASFSAQGPSYSSSVYSQQSGGKQTAPNYFASTASAAPNPIRGATSSSGGSSSSRPQQLARLTSPLPSSAPTPSTSATAASKTEKTRQLVKKPHSFGSGYSFEISG